MIALKRQAVLLLVLLLVPISWFTHRVRSQGGILVGYAVLTPSQSSPVLAASALFSFRNAEGLLLSEAGIEAVEPISRGRIFVDLEAPGSNTGLALANSSDQPVSYRVRLRDSGGSEKGTKELELGAGRHESFFVNDARLFAEEATEGFVGSMTFETLEGGKLAAVTIRQTVLAADDVVFATLPVADLDAPVGPTGGSGQTIVFPHLGAGGPLTSQIILIARPGEAVSGQIEFFVFDPATGDPRPGGLRLDGAEGSSFPFQMAADGTYRATLTSTGDVVQGYAVITVESGEVAAGTAVFQFRDGTGNLTSEAGVGAVPATTRARILVDTTGTQTGVAIASPGAAAEVTFELLDRNGESLDTVTRDLEAGGHLAAFVSQLFAGLPAGFLGVVEIRSDALMVPITLKLTSENSRGLILTTLPIADLTRVRQGVVLVIPQVGWASLGGLNLTTRLILINSSTTAATGSLVFVQSNGAGLIPPSETDDQINYQIGGGGIGDLQQGQVSLSRIDLNLGDPSLAEIVVNEGNQLLVNPSGRDTLGRVRADVEVGFSNLDDGVAEVSPSGVISGMSTGFSTLTLRGGGIERKVTITVQRVESSPTVAFTDVRGVAQVGSTIYMAAGGDHTLLRFESLSQAPAIYAGISQTPGFLNDDKLVSLFRGPAFLSLDKNRGEIHVTDSANHVVRLIHPGDPDPSNPDSPRGRVETFAGTGTPGSDDGPRAQASFNNPQGIARGGGYLWIADSSNHTIRRIDLNTDMVETLAGMAGEAGNTDGAGAQARFSSPTGVALDRKDGQLTLIVADTGNGVLRRVFGDDSRVQTLGAAEANLQAIGAGRRYRTSVEFAQPVGVAVDSFGNIYVTEPMTGQVKTLLTNGDVVEAAQQGSFGRPGGLSIQEAGTLLVAEEDGTAGRIVYGTPEILSTNRPLGVPTEGGVEVTVEGSNFAPETVLVVRGQVVSDVEIVNTGTLRFIAPRLPEGLTTLTVQHRGGTAQTALLVRPPDLAEIDIGAITTVAGGTDFLGDGGLAAEAGLRTPFPMAVDSAGNIFFTDADSVRVRRIDAGTGLITTVAGSGARDGSGDGGPATAAGLEEPRGIALDGAGNLYIADATSNRVRRVDAGTAVISTVAGNGDYGFQGDGFEATETPLASPSAVALDSSGNLFIADTDNQRIRRVDHATNLISTVAGDGTQGSDGDGGPATSARLDRPAALVVDLDGSVFIAGPFPGPWEDPGYVRRVDGATGMIERLANDDDVQLPQQLALDSAGNLLVADTFNNRIRRVNTATHVITTVAGTGDEGFSGDGGSASEATFSLPHGVAVDAADSLFVSDTGNDRIRRVDPATGLIETIAGGDLVDLVGDGGLATAATLRGPRGVARDDDGNLFIVDAWNCLIRKVDVTTGLISTLYGSPDEELFFKAVAVDGEGNVFFTTLFVVLRIDAETGEITLVAGGGEGGDDGPAIDADLVPDSIAVDEDGNLFIADRRNYSIRRVDAESGVITTVAGNGQSEHSGDNGPATQAGMYPNAVALDSVGNLFIGDGFNHRIRRVDAASGLITTVAGDGADDFYGDGGLAVNAAFGMIRDLAVDTEGNIFVADGGGFDVFGFFDTGNNRIRRIDGSTGVITTVAGNDGFGYPGGGGPAASTALETPTGVFVDANGDVYFSVLGTVSGGRILAIRGPLSGDQ